MQSMSNSNQILEVLGSFATTTVESFLFYAGIYLVFAGIPYLVFWQWKKEAFAHKKIQQNSRRPPRARQEIGYSLLTLLTFSAMLGVLFELPRLGITQLYFSIGDYGWIWFVVSIVLMTLAHDTYYYWAHRAMHTRWLFKHVHVVHHQFTNPTPFAAYAFHPGEIIIEIAVFAVLVFLFPIHPLAIAVYIVLLTYLNVISHLGFELYTSNIHRWFITSTHHNMHHSRVNGNFMLYFNIWDRLMGTNHEQFESLYEELASAKPAKDKAAGRGADSDRAVGQMR